MEKTDQFLNTLQEMIMVFMHNSMHNALRYSKECGWSMSQIGVLRVIHRQGTTAISDIGDAMGVSTPAASQLIERLVQEGLVLRTEDPDDRRVKQIQLTEKGQGVLVDSLHARHTWLKILDEQLSEEEKQIVSQAIEILINRAKNIDLQPQGEDSLNTPS